MKQALIKQEFIRFKNHYLAYKRLYQKIMFFIRTRQNREILNNYGKLFAILYSKKTINQ